MLLADEEATAKLGHALAALLQPGDVIALSGALGAGKTSLARSILQALGEQEEVPSPSFAIVQPYDHLGLPAWHADLYRLENPAELPELGLEDIGEGVLLVEWPERALGAWPQALALTIEAMPDGARRLTAQVPAAWKGRWPPQ